MLFKNGEVELKCPRCNKIMDKIKKKDIVIDICPSCKGMWLDNKEIDKLIQMGKGGKGGKKK